MSEESKKRFFSEITKAEALDNGVVSLAIRPNQPSNYGQGSLSGKQLQERFDRLAGLIIERYNEMAAGLSSDEVLEYFKLPKVDGDYITLPNGAIDISSFIKNISDGDGNLIVETPYVEDKDTIKSILAQIYTDLQEIYADYATKAALQLHSSDEDEKGDVVTTAHPDIREQIGKDIALHNSDKDADDKDVTDTHPSIRRLIPDKIDEHNIATGTHKDIREKIGDDIALHSSDKDADGKVVTTAHPDIREQIGKDINGHNTSGDAHEDIRELIAGIIGKDGTLTQLEKVVDDFLTGAADNDTTLENLKEIVAYIELNRETIDRIIGVNGAEGLLDGKIDKTSIVTNLTTEDDTKVLAASVGKQITDELDKRVRIVDGDPVVRVSDLDGYAVESDENPIVRANTLDDYAKTTTENGTVVRETADTLVARKNDIPDVSGFLTSSALTGYAQTTTENGTVVRETNNTLVARKSDLVDFVKDSNDNPIVRGGNIGSYLTDYAKETNDKNETIVRQTSETPVARLSDILTITDIEDAGFFKEDSRDPVVTQNDLDDYAKTTTDDGGAVVRTNDLSSTLENYALSSDLEGYAPLVDEYARNVAYDNPEDPFITTAVLDSRLENIEVGGGGGDIAVDGITLDANEEDLIEAQAVRCVDNGDVEFAEDRKYLKFFVGTKDEYDSLNDKSGVLAIIKEQGMPTSAEVKSAVDYYGNIRNGFTAVPRAVADEDGNAFESSYLKKADAANTYAKIGDIPQLYRHSLNITGVKKNNSNIGFIVHCFVFRKDENKISSIQEVSVSEMLRDYRYEGQMMFAGNDMSQTYPITTLTQQVSAISVVYRTGFTFTSIRSETFSFADTDWSITDSVNTIY